MFSWITFFEELLSRVCKDFDSESLAKLAHEIFNHPTSLMDKLQDGSKQPLKELDPLTFIAYFNRGITNENRIALCRAVKEKLSISSPIPADFTGIPSINNQASWFFDFEPGREKYAFKKNWAFAKALSDDSLTDEIFSDALSISHVALAKLTQLCFICKPSHYLALDKNTQSYLEKNGLLDTLHKMKKVQTYTMYLELLKAVKTKFPNQTFPEISSAAYRERNENEYVRYWVAGACWGKDDQIDKTEEFIKNGVWQNGYEAESNDPSLEKVKEVSVNDWIAIKSSFTKKRTTPCLRIKAIGRVTENLGDGRNLKVEWLYTVPVFDVDGISYRKTFQECRNEVDENAIFNRVKGNASQPEHFLVYHKAHENGLLNLTPNEQCSFYSNKPKAFLDKTVGHWVWILEANKDEVGKPTYDLAGIYVPLMVKKENESLSIEGNMIQVFSPKYRLNKLDWFDSLFLKTNFYSHGFQSLGNDLRDRFLGLTRNQMKTEKLMTEKKPQVGNKITNYSAKNVILYGPPGVGKTHELLKRREQFVSMSESSPVKIAQWASERSWWEVIAAALIDLNRPSSVTEIGAHQFLQAKIKQSKTKTPKNSIWGLLQGHTVESSKTVQYKTRSVPLVFDKSEDSKWFLTGDWADALADLIKDVSTLKSTSTSQIRRYEVVTFHQSYSYEDFVEGIRPVTDEGSDTLRYVIEDGIFKRICQRARADAENDYAIFIDEINRGNIAKIFGELITLIEADKRDGGDNSTSAVLPYSKEEFSIPSNLYIIGTMNSVDRSIALLDIAIRRRFSFLKIEPNSSLVIKDIEGIDFRSIYEGLNEKIAVLLGEDYRLGHSYFMNGHAASLDALKVTWFDNVIPLLQEYFFDDWEKIKALIPSFINSKPVSGLSNLGLMNTERHTFASSSITKDDFKAKLKALENHLKRA